MRKHFLALLSIFLTIVILVSCVPPATPVPAAPTSAPAQPVTPGPKPGLTATPATATPAPPPPRPGEAPYYQGKTVEVMVESAAGGGTDAIARITAPFLSKYLPGNPRLVIRNQSGAAGAVANAIFYEKVKPDGFTLLQNSSSPIGMQLKQRELAKYDVTKYRHIGNIARAESVLLVRKGQVWRLTDSSAKPLVVGVKEGEEAWNAAIMWGKEFLGWNVRWVPGFGGTSEIEMAFRRGEVDMFASMNAFILKRMQEEGLAETLLQVGSMKEGRFQRRPDFPDVPTFVEALGDKRPTGLPWQAYMAFIGQLMIDKSLAAPPRTPDNVMAILTGAFTKAVNDPKFDEMMKKTVTDVYVVNVGKDTDELIKQILDSPPEALEWGKQLQRKFLGTGAR